MGVVVAQNGVLHNNNYYPRAHPLRVGVDEQDGVDNHGADFLEVGYDEDVAVHRGHDGQHLVEPEWV